jgi:hypothetical protein
MLAKSQPTNPSSPNSKSSLTRGPFPLKKQAVAEVVKIIGIGLHGQFCNFL